jgi:hypothetical protein
MLCDSRTTEAYESFFKFLKEQTKDRFKPDAVIGDFEEAIRAGLNNVFPETLFFGDLFHFLQANLRWLHSNKLSSRRSECAVDLKILWASSTLELLSTNIANFLKKWRAISEEYATYFDNTWVHRFRPKLWANVYRDGKFPSGDQALEGWHNRFQNYIVQNPRQSIDKIVGELWNEWLYYQTFLSSEILQNQHKMSREKQLQYRPAVQNIVESNVPYDFGVSDAPDGVPNEPASSTPSTVDPVPESQSPPASNLQSNTNTDGTLCLCGRRKNKACGLCKQCCVKSSKRCTVSSHITPTTVNPYATMIAAAIEAKSQLWLNYSGGSNPGTVRPIKPLRWKSQPYSFLALCVNTGVEKTYKSDRIKDLKETEFVPLT